MYVSEFVHVNLRIQLTYGRVLGVVVRKKSCESLFERNNLHVVGGILGPNLHVPLVLWVNKVEKIVLPLQLPTSIISKFAPVPLDVPRSMIVSILLFLLHRLIEKPFSGHLNPLRQLFGDPMVH